jgi:archaellum component FlaC
MQTVAWTDERLEERFDGIDRRFDEVNRHFGEVDRRFDEVDRRFDEVDRKFEGVNHRFDRVESQIAVLQAGFNRIWISIVAGLFGVIAAILVKGG